MLQQQYRALFFITLSFILSSGLKAQTSEKIDPEVLQQNIGQQVTYCDHVFDTYQGKSEKSPVMLNLGAKYPNQALTVVIFQRDLPNFKYNPLTDLKDEDICITGKVEVYREKLQIIANKETQILVKEKSE